MFIKRGGGFVCLLQHKPTPHTQRVERREKTKRRRGGGGGGEEGGDFDFDVELRIR